MPAPGQSTFDGNPNTSPPTVTPYRPGLPDFNGAQLQNDPVYVPDPNTMPTASLFNTYGYEIVSIGKMIPVAFISVNAGASATTAFWSTAANNIASNPFTITRTAAGNYNITFAANTFPAPAAQANAVLNVVLGAHNYGIGVVNIANGVQVTTTQDAVLTDLNFTAYFY